MIVCENDIAVCVVDEETKTRKMPQKPKVYQVQYKSVCSPVTHSIPVLFTSEFGSRPHPRPDGRHNTPQEHKSTSIGDWHVIVGTRRHGSPEHATVDAGRIVRPEWRASHRSTIPSPATTTTPTIVDA